MKSQNRNPWYRRKFFKRLAQRFLPQNSPKARFSAVYHFNMWGDPESRSGEGSRSDSGQVKDCIAALHMVCDTYGVSSINDIPCGDFNWMHGFLRARPGLAYTGYDIVPALIKANRARHRGVQFKLLDITSAVPPRADLVFCKDMLNHLTYADVQKALANMKLSGSQWLLASNNFDEPNTELRENRNEASRHLDITLPPLGYAKPVWNTHYLGLWRLSDL